MPAPTRRQLLTAIAIAGATGVARRVLADSGAGATVDPVRLSLADDQALIRQCDLRDAPWLKAKLEEEFNRYRPGWAAVRRDLQDRCRSMASALDESAKRGCGCPIANQIYSEARWLAYSTTDKERILRRFTDFDEAFGREKDSPNAAPVEQSEDGSWAPHVSEPFLKLEISIDYINRIVDPGDSGASQCAIDGPVPQLKYPLTFLKHWADPDGMIRELQRLRRSAIHRTGAWNRQEYSSLLSTLAQLMFKKPIVRWLERDVRDSSFTRDHAAKFAAFLDDAQDPCTGCWRDGYDFGDGTSHDAYDLSNLYHIVQYRREGIKHWDSIAGGLIAVRNLQYPQGALGPPEELDHNAYDVVRIVIRCLDDAKPSISAEQGAQLTQYVRQLALDSVSRLQVAFPPSDRSGDPEAADRSNYFTVKFLKLVGFWTGKSRFLTTEEMKDRHRLAAVTLARLVAANDASPLTQQSIGLLKTYLGKC